MAKGNRHTKTEMHSRFARPISRVMKWTCEGNDVRLKSCSHSDRSKGPELDPWHGFESGFAARQGHNSILCLAEEEPLVYDQHGSLTDQQRTTQLFDLIWSIISEAFKVSNERCSTIPSSTSLKDFLAEKLVQQELNLDEQTLVLQLAEMWGSYTGDPLEAQSLRYMWLEECLDGGKQVYLRTHYLPGGVLFGWTAMLL